MLIDKRYSQRMILHSISSIAIGFLVGVAWFSFHREMTVSPFLLFIIIPLIFSFIFSRKSKLLIIILSLLLGFVLGLMRFSYALPSENIEILKEIASDNREVVFEGIVVSDPEYYKDKSHFILETTHLYSSLEEIEVSTKIRVTGSPYKEVQYGDIFLIEGTLKEPTSFDSYGGRTFAYDTYLAKDGIFFTSSYPSLTKIGEERGGIRSLIFSLYRLKNHFIEKANEQIPQPESGLLAGILFGKVDALGDEVTEQFRRVGLMHIVVLSGYNVSLVIHLMMRIFVFFPLQVRAILSVLGIVLFALLVGGGPTVIRASIMALFIVLGGLVGRKYHVQRALFIAGIIMVVMNPWILIFDISFQLSFLATYGLITYSPFIEQWLRWVPNIFEMRLSLVATLSAQIMVTPLLLYAIGDFSIISPIVNMIVLFAVPWGMAFGFIASVFYTIPMLSLLAFLPLKFIIWVVDAFAYVPYGIISFPAFSIWVMIIMYAVLFISLYSIQKKQDTSLMV